MSLAWYKLDNSAKLFPAISNSRNSSVFRLSLLLEDEIDGDRLQNAANKTFESYPMYMVRLSKGIFWNYLNPIKSPIKVEREQEYPCRPFDFEFENKLIRILYANHRISIEVFHSLTDGFGAMEFLKTLVHFYINGDKQIEVDGIRTSNSFDKSDIEDGYIKNYKKHFYIKKTLPAALHIKGSPYSNHGAKVTHGHLDAQQLLFISRKYNSTVTAFLTGVLIKSIAMQVENPSERPIVVSIPVNLRKHYESTTLNNFFGVANVGEIVDREDSLENIICSVNNQLRSELSANSIQSFITNNVSYGKIPGVKFIPLILKNKTLNIGSQILGENKKTISISNLGVMSFPREHEKKIRGIEAILYPTSTSPINCAVVTLGEKVVISFIQSITDNSIIREFFRILATDYNMDISIYSNEKKGVIDNELL